MDINLPYSYTTISYKVLCEIGLALTDFRYYFTTYFSKISESQIRLKIGRAAGNEGGYLAINYVTVN